MSVTVYTVCNCLIKLILFNHPVFMFPVTKMTDHFVIRTWVVDVETYTGYTLVFHFQTYEIQGADRDYRVTVHVI